jgi:hypothetical protein
MDDRMLASVRPRLVLVKAVGTARPAQSQSGGYFDAIRTVASVKNSDAPAVKREAEEEWGNKKWR